jgi:cadmium resistance protein CadD (predicted permease)
VSDVDRLVLDLLIVGAVASNLYSFFYAFRPWRKTPQGRALMVKSLGNVIVIDLSLAFVAFGDYPGRNMLRVLGFTLFVIGIWYLLVSLLTSPGARDYPPWSWLRRRDER